MSGTSRLSESDQRCTTVSNSCGRKSWATFHHLATPRKNGEPAISFSQFRKLIANESPRGDPTNQTISLDATDEQPAQPGLSERLFRYFHWKERKVLCPEPAELCRAVDGSRRACRRTSMER